MQIQNRPQESEDDHCSGWFCKLWEDTRRTHSQNWYHWKIPVWSRWQRWWWIGVCYILNICGGNTRECQILHFSAKNPKFFLAYLIQLDITNIHLKFVYLFTKGRGSQYTSQHIKIYLKCTIFGFDRKFQCLWPVGQLWSFGHKLSVNLFGELKDRYCGVVEPPNHWNGSTGKFVIGTHWAKVSKLKPQESSNGVRH